MAIHGGRREADRDGQWGMSLSGLLVSAVIVVLAVLFLLKIIPPYIEYLNVKKDLTAVAKDPALQDAPVAELRKAFDKRADVDDITVVKGSDISVTRQGNAPVLSVSYSVKVPLVANANLCLDFNISSND